HGTVCVVGKMRDLILQLSKSSIYSTKPFPCWKRMMVQLICPLSGKRKKQQKINRADNYNRTDTLC
ncbi:hypothetical protein P7F80_25340, partial [Enterobacter hormaechei]|nr:hypothetical protein [Enterobacter hormaechei]